MNKLEGPRTRYYVQWDTHARHMCTVLCSLMEHQSLVDLAICCGTNTIHAHKCVLAANSPYFREQLEKNTGTEQIVITGLDFGIVKSIIEFMYCGETNILDENLKYMIAAAKFFQMRGLQTLVSDNQDLRYEADSIHIPPPTFLPKKPKYPNAYRSLNNATTPPTFDSYKTPVQSDPYVHRKIKRKFVRSEAEKACAKEAAASRLALEALQKELAGTAQLSSFVIEESCTETTVENFIPHSDETFIENINRIDGVPLQVVNYGDLSGSLLTENQLISINKSDSATTTMPFGIRTNTNKDKLKRILGNNLSNNIEIMYRTNEGDIVNVTADVLQNLSGDALQYQIIDEHGQIRELREFQNNDQNCCSSNYETTPCIPPLGNTLIQQDISDTKSFISTQNENYVRCSDLEILNSNESNEIGQNFEVASDKLENTNDIFPNMINSYNQNTSENHNNVNATTNISAAEQNIIINNSLTSPSQEKVTNDTILSTDKIYEADLFADVLSKPKETSPQTEENTASSTCEVNRFLNLGEIQILEDCKKEKFFKDECQTPLKGNKKRVAVKKSNVLGVRKLRTMTAENNVNDNSNSSDQDNQIIPECEMIDSNNDQKNSQVVLANIDLTSDNNCDIPMETLEQDDKENDASDSPVTFKKMKFAQSSKPSVSNLTIEPIDEGQILEDILISETHSSRKTRSSLRTIEDNQDSLNQCKEPVDDGVSHNMKYDKPRRIMRNRKKKSN